MSLYYDRKAEAPEPCLGCDEPVLVGDRLNSRLWDTGYCLYCREICPVCNDWIAGKPETEDWRGRRQHVHCEVQAIFDAMDRILEEKVGQGIRADQGHNDAGNLDMDGAG